MDGNFMFRVNCICHYIIVNGVRYGMRYHSLENYFIKSIFKSKNDRQIIKGKVMALSQLIY